MRAPHKLHEMSLSLCRGGRFEEDRPKIMGPVFARLRLSAGQGTDRKHICSGYLTV